MSMEFFFLIKKIKLKAFFLGIIVILLIFTSLILITYHLAYYQKIYPFVKIGPVQIGNHTKLEAEQKIQTYLEKNSIKTIDLVFEQKIYQIPSQKLGLQYQIKSAVEQAYQIGRQQNLMANFKDKYQAWTKGKSIDLDYQLNWFLLDKKITSISAELETAPQRPKVKIDNQQIRVFEGKNGKQIDRNHLNQQIDKQLSNLKPVKAKIKLKLIKTALTDSQVQILKQRGEKFLDKKIAWQTKNQSGQIGAEQIVPILTYQGHSEKKLKNLVDFLSKQVDKQPVNALFEFENNRVKTFQPDQIGCQLNKEEAYDLLINQLKKIEAGQEVKSINLPVNYQGPDIKTEDINNLGIKKQIGRGQSTFWHSISSRIHNIQLTAQKINGILVKPEEIFSFNQAVGEVSRATGYQSAYIIKDGRTILGDGGGVCQVSTTLFRAILNAGLPIVERHPHSYRVSYYEQNYDPGFDATVYSPHPDLRFKNDTKNYILIQTKTNIDQRLLQINFYGTQDERQVEISPARVWAVTPPPEDLYIDDPTLPTGTVKQIDWKSWGAKVAFDWKVTRNNQVLQDRTFYSHYQPWQAVYLRGTK